MFTMEQIKAAHSKVKSGADFPAYVKDLKDLGMTAYEHYVTDGHTFYSGTNYFSLVSDAKYPPMDIADISSTEKLQQALAVHQLGQTDYSTFCKESAGAGVEKWMNDLEKMTCTYYNKAGNEMLVESIPAA